MEETANKYYTWIDTAKCIGIFLVIYGHGGLAIPPIKELIYTFHMPLFFMLSGLLYHPISLKQTLKKDWHTLIIPYFLLNLLCLLPFLFNIFKNTFTFEGLFQRLGAIVLGLGYEHGFWIPVSTPCWFLISLFFARIIFAIFYKNLSNKTILMICLISIASTLFLHYQDIDLLIPIDSALLAMPFLCIGYKMKPILLKYDITRNKCIMFCITVLSFLLMCFVCYFNGMVDINKCIYGKSIISFYLGGTLGALSIYALSKCFYIRGVLSYFSNRYFVDYRIEFINDRMHKKSMFYNFSTN